MIELILAAATLIPAHTEEGRRLKIRVTADRVTRVSGTAEHYRCQDFGDLGPLRFSFRTGARINKRGRFSFVAGDRNERIGVAGHIKRRKASGRIRLTGSIATGQRCKSPTVRFSTR